MWQFIKPIVITAYNSFELLKDRKYVRFLHVLALFCCPLGGRGSFSPRWWQAHLQRVASSGVFKAAAPEHQRQIVLHAEWYQDVDWMFPMIYELLLTCVFPRLSSGFRTLCSGACLRGTRTVKPSFMPTFFSSFGAPFVLLLFIHPIEELFWMLNCCLVSPFGS